MTRQKKGLPIDRSTVKKAVMTTPFGIGVEKIAEYLEETKFARKMKEKGSVVPRASVCMYLARRLVNCIRETMEPGDKLKRWLQEIATAIGAQGQPIRWKVPSGFPVVVAEWERMTTIIAKGRMGMTIFRIKKPFKISVKEQKKKIAPNFVHSFDAAHLALTIKRLALKEGLQHFGVVHGCDVETLNRVLREEFVRIYSKDVLQEFYDEQLEALAKSKNGSGIVLPAPPKRGDFDIKEVLNSTYFFS
jgi:DNA-directed RNA polymerase